MFPQFTVNSYLVQPRVSLKTQTFAVDVHISNPISRFYKLNLCKLWIPVVGENLRACVTKAFKKEKKLHWRWEVNVTVETPSNLECGGVETFLKMPVCSKTADAAASQPSHCCSACLWDASIKLVGRKEARVECYAAVDSYSRVGCSHF